MELTGNYRHELKYQIGLAVALVIGLFIFIIYKKTLTGVLYSSGFALTLVGLSLVTTLVIMAVTSNVVLSLGMVGALSIVRFRTAIKEPVEIVFLFWSLAVGIVIGAGMIPLAVIGSAIIAAGMAAAVCLCLCTAAFFGPIAAAAGETGITMAYETALFDTSGVLKVNIRMDEADWNEAQALLKQQKPLVQSYVMDEIFNKMKNGSAAVSSYYAGDFLTMYEDNEDLAFIYPESGTNIFVDAMCIPSVARHKEIAEEYINFLLSEDIAVANAEQTYYASPNVLVRESETYIENMSEVHGDVMEILYPTQEVPSTYYQNLDPETTAYMNSLWEGLKVESAAAPGVYIFAGVIVLLLIVMMLYKWLQNKVNSRYY